MLQHGSCVIKASCQSQATWELTTSVSTHVRPSSERHNTIWLGGTDGQRRILSVITLLTNFLKLLLINKECVGVAAQGKPQAIFQLVSPEKQIGILHGALRKE